MKHRKNEIPYRIIIVLIKTYWKIIAPKFKFIGLENIPTQGGAIVASNHLGFLDFAFIGTAALPRKRLIRFMAKKEIFDNKIAGPWMMGMGHISVDRENGAPSLVAALRALKKGELVGIFPEGTIPRNFDTKEMKTGAVRLSMGSGAPVIPTAIWGSQRYMTTGHPPKLSTRKIPIWIKFGEPIFYTKEQDVHEAEEQMRAKIIELLVSIQNNYPDSPQNQWWAPKRLGGIA